MTQHFLTFHSQEKSICQSSTIPVKTKKHEFSICTGENNHRQP